MAFLLYDNVYLLVVGDTSFAKNRFNSTIFALYNYIFIEAYIIVHINKIYT